MDEEYPASPMAFCSTANDSSTLVSKIIASVSLAYYFLAASIYFKLIIINKRSKLRDLNFQERVFIILIT
jgi:hypothetical protein